MIPLLDLKSQIEQLRPQIDQALRDVIDHGTFILGPKVGEFETAVARYLNVKHAVGVNSGTDALTIGLRALGVGRGDEVITTPFSFFAAAEAVENLGARAVFADVEPDSFNVNPIEVKKRLSDKTKVILPVHLFGLPANIQALRDTARENGLRLLEDCAQAFGSAVDGKKTGSWGDLGAFSFFPSKNLGAFGDGGLIATDDDEIAGRCRMLRAHGGKNKYNSEMFGYNSRLDTIQAAILSVKLPLVDQWNRQRRGVARWYCDALEGTKGIVLPRAQDGHVFHQFTIRVLGGRRAKVQAALAEAEIASAVYYFVPIHKLPVYVVRDREPCPVSEKLANEVLSLPIFPEMTEAMVSKVAESLKKGL